MVGQLRRDGDRVWVRTVTAADVAPYRQAVLASAPRLSRWNPVDPDDLGRHLRAQSASHRTFVVHAHDPAGGHGIVGKINVTNVVRGRFRNATLGYDAYDPYAGTGMFAEGLRLVVDLAFAPEPAGMGLHRLEANVQPGNATSAGLLRRLGFRREGHVPRMLWLAGEGGTSWRRHDCHAITAEEWPAPSYPPHEPAPVVALLAGPGAADPEPGRLLARELGVPLLRAGGLDDLPELPWARLCALLADCPAGAVLDPGAAVPEPTEVAAGLLGAGVDPDRAVLVRLESGGTAAAGPGALGAAWDRAPAGLGLRRVVRLDARDAGSREVTRAALQVRALALEGLPARTAPPLRTP